jgi:hypothetical protein
MAHPGAPVVTAAITVSEVAAGRLCKNGRCGVWLFLRLANSSRHHKSTTTVQAIGTFRLGSARMAVSGHVPDVGVRLSYRGHLARTKTISNFCFATAW